MSFHHQGSWSELCAWFPSGPPLRAVIFDVYGTLLTVQDAPRDPQDAALNAKLQELVAAEHATATGKFPEVDWVSLFGRCFPETTTRSVLARMARHHARRQRRCKLASGAAEFIRACPVPMGLCTNAQAYTLSELGLALRAEGLRLGSFDLGRSFLSYQHGIAKPHPDIFPQLTTQWGDPPAALLMVGDRLDNDVLPAQAAGWSTWQLVGDGSGQGNFPKL